MKLLKQKFEVRILLGIAFAFCVFFVFSDNSASAAALSRYWVGADSGCKSNNWNDTACWSASSGGSPGASVPNNSIFDTYTVYFTSAATGADDCNVNISPTLTAMYMQSGYSNTVYAGSSTMSFVANLSILSGTFDPGSSTVVFGSATSSSILDINVSQSFHNLTINKTHSSSNILNTSTNDTITILGTLYLVEGRLGVRSGGQIICNNPVSWDSTFDGANPSATYLGYLVLRDDTIIPAGQINVPGLRIDNVLNPALEVTTGVGTGGINFYGNFEIVENSGTGGTFSNSANQDLNFMRLLTINNGTFYAGSAPSSSPNITFSSGTGTKTVTIADGEFYARSATINMDTYGSFVVSGGTFYGADSTITILRTSTNITISSGAFIAPSGNMTLYGGFAHTAGTFTHSNGTVIFDGTGFILVDVPASGGTFYNLFIRKDNDTSYVYTNADTIEVLGELELSRGMLGVRTGGYLQVKGSIDWQSTFNGRYATSSYYGYLQFFISSVVIPEPAAGLTPQIPSIMLEATQLETDSGGTSALTFGGYLVVNGTSSFENVATVDITYNRTVTINDGYIDVYGGTQNFAEDLIVNSDADSVILTGNINFTSSGSTLQINGGTVYAQNADMNMDGGDAFDLNAGTFNAPSSGKTMYIYGNFSVDSGAVFNPGLGTVYFDGTTISNITVPSGFVFRNMTMDKGADTNYLYFPSGSTPTVLGTLTLGNGKLSIYNSASLTAEGTLNWTSDFDGAYESTSTRGPLIIKTTGSSGDVDIPDTDIVWPVLQLDNSNKSDLRVRKLGYTYPVTVYNFTIDTGSGSGATFELDPASSMTVSNALTMNNGSFLTKGADLTLYNFNISGGLLSADTATVDETVVSVTGNTAFTVSGGEVDLTEAESFISTSGATTNIYLTGGTFKAPPYISLARGLDFEAGSTFVHNFGVVELETNLSSSLYTDGTNSLYNLTISKDAIANTIDFSGNINIDGDLRLFTGTLDFNNFTHNIAGDLVLSGTSTEIVEASSTVVLDGYGQTISGPWSFYNLTKISEDAETLYFLEDTIVTILNTTTLSGVDSVNRLSLRTDGNNSLQWKIDPQGTRVFSYLDIMDSNNVNATVAIAGTGSLDSGNNTNWSFGYKYWVGSEASCNGSFSDSDCWAASSGGSGGQDVPGVNDTVFFDSSDTSDCLIDSVVDVKGIRIEPGYTGEITVDSVSVTVGTDRFLQRDGDFLMTDADMINTDNFYLYGGYFEMDGGDFSSLDFYYNYFTPRTASGNFSAVDSMDINGHFVFGSNTDNSSGTFTAPSGNMNVSGNFYSYASNNSVFTANGGTFIFDGAGDSVYDYYDSDVSFNNLTLNKSSGSAKLTVSADIDINGNLSIATGTFEVPTLSSPNIFVAGNFLRTNLSGVFSPGYSEVILDGGSQLINNSNTFYALTKLADSVSETLTFQAGSTTTITNDASIKGTSSYILNLRSSTDSSVWYINPSGQRVFSYVDVKDSTNSAALAISALSSVDSGNNTNWDFGYKYWVGPDAGSWNDSSNWSAVSGGSGGAGVPDSNSFVVFDGSTSCDIPDSYDVNIASLTLASTFTSEVRGGDGTLTISGDLNIRGGKLEMETMDLVVSTDFYLTGGVFASTSGSGVVGGRFLAYEGSFYAGNTSTFTVNSFFEMNNGSGYDNDAIVDFSDVTTLDLNSWFVVGSTSGGAFYGPLAGTVNVALDVFLSTDSSVFDTNLVMDSGNSVTLQCSNQTLDSVTIDKQSPLNSVLFSTDLRVSENLTFTVGTVYPAGDIYVGGDWVMGESAYTNFVSTYATGDKTVYLNGENQAIYGSTTFANLSKVISVGTTPLLLNFESGETQTITGSMTLEGLSTSVRLLLRATDETFATYIDPQGSRTVSFLDVQDNYNINSTEIEAYNTGSVDSGNNDAWSFDLTINSWVDAFSTFNAHLFSGAYRGSMIIYKIFAQYINSWSMDYSLSGAGRIRSSIVFDGGLYLGASDGNLYRRNDLTAAVKSSSDVLNGQYSHLVYNFKAGLEDRLSLYINGELDSFNDVTNDASEVDFQETALYFGTSYGSTIGGNNASGEEYFTGKIDEIRLSNQSFTDAYIETVYNNLSDPTNFITFGTEEEYDGQPGGSTELPTMTDKEAVDIRGEIGAGSLWISANGDLANGIRLEQGRVSPEAEKVKWLYDEGTDYISFGDSASPDGFRLQLYMVSEDGGNFVYSGTSIGQFNVPVENFVVYGNYDTLGGVGQAPSKAVDDSVATLNIDPSKSCSEALNLSNYTFHEDLTSGDFGMSLSGVPQDYLKSNVPCITEGTIDLRAFELLIPPNCAEGGYNSTLYILMLNGSGL
ncbi:MAG: hypothetical protein RBS56_01685 [Candidatus Gracilibacteria bacterium]|jgi:hypothetical protein|nr:hypothetical protein [Candidatus Gracilibacteria bacterium]